MAEALPPASTTIRPNWRQKVSPSKFMGASFAAGSALEGRVENNERKITTITNILRLRKSNEKGGIGHVESIIGHIADSITSIADTLREEHEFKKEKKEDDRVEKEQEERTKTEKGRENKLFKGLQSTAQKVLAPVKGVFDQLVKFLGTLLLGSGVLKLLEFLQNPENEKKLQLMGRFLKDWWPAILTSALVLGGALALIGPLSIIAPLVSAAAGAIATLSPYIAGLALISAGAWLPKLFPQSVDQQEKKTTAAVEELGEDKVRADLERKANNPTFLERLQGVDAEAREQLHLLDTGETKSYGFNQGGYVSGPSGKDQVPARLTDGEFVMSKGAVATWGSSLLASMNAAGGGNNTPVGNRFDGGGSVDAISPLDITAVKVSPLTKISPPVVGKPEVTVLPPIESRASQSSTPEGVTIRVPMFRATSGSSSRRIKAAILSLG